MEPAEQDITTEVFRKIKFKETHPAYAARYRQLKALEHLFPGEGIMKIMEIVSYLKRKGFTKLTPDDLTKKYHSTGPRGASPNALF